MLRSIRRRLPARALATVIGAALTAALAFALPARAETVSPYAPYEFLIGDWDTAPEGAEAGFTLSFQWGTNRSFILFGASLLRDGAAEPHFEGVLMWNGMNRNLDMLVMLDLSPTAQVQENGTMAVESDGTVVRDHVAVYSPGVRLPSPAQATAGPDGATIRFRQTFKIIDENHVFTALMTETATGWVPTFPGSDKLVMTRRAAAQ